MPKTIGNHRRVICSITDPSPNPASRKSAAIKKELGNDVTPLEDYYSFPSR